MPAATRSSTKQAHIDDPKEVQAPVTGSKRKATDVTPPSGKRKAEPKKPAGASQKSDSKPGQKKPRAAKPEDEESPEDEGDDSILINRAPVLELWAASVTKFGYPELPWETCLSVGSAISTLCAISKGRSIGKIDPPDDSKRREKQAEDDEIDKVEVMGFHLKLRDGQALVSEKPKKANEGGLKGKFGEAAYGRVKGVFEESLGVWKGREEELDGRAFRAYEEFRPNVAKGQKGWGRKGMLSLQTVRDAVALT